MEKSRNYHLKIPAPGYEAYQHMAQLQGRDIAVVIREALEEYARKHGYEVSFAVKHGGNRRAPSD